MAHSTGWQSRQQHEAAQARAMGSRSKKDEISLARIILRGEFLDQFEAYLEKNPGMSYSEVVDTMLMLEESQADQGALEQPPWEHISQLGMATSHPDYIESNINRRKK